MQWERKQKKTADGLLAGSQLQLKITEVNTTSVHIAFAEAIVEISKENYLNLNILMPQLQGFDGKLSKLKERIK